MRRDWRKKKANKMAKLRSRWAYGIFVGVRPKSGELLVADKRGEIQKVRWAKRIPKEDRWSVHCAEWVKHTPWNRYRGDPAEDGDIAEEKKMEARRRVLKEEMEGEEKEDLVKKKYVAPRAFKIAKEDAEKHGYTRGCAGCVSWFRGLARQPHTKECRERFEEAMKGDAKVARAAEQKMEFARKVATRKGVGE